RERSRVGFARPALQGKRSRRQTDDYDIHPNAESAPVKAPPVSPLLLSSSRYSGGTERKQGWSGRGEQLVGRLADVGGAHAVGELTGALQQRQSAVPFPFQQEPTPREA